MPDGPVCLDDFEVTAAAVLPADVRDFIAGGSGREQTVDANRAAFDRLFVVPRVLRDVSAGTTATRLLGRHADLPVAVAPVAYHALVHPDGELAAARAALAAGVPFTVSTLSSVPVERLTDLGGDVWFQLYWMRDRNFSLELVRRAEQAGCRAVMLTVDVPWMARRLRDVRNQFTLPGHVRAVHLEPGADAVAHRHASGTSAVAVHTAQLLSSALTWAHLDDLRAATDLPVIVKGILAPEDARRATESGADAIVVSNHGGRQLDGAIPTIDALPDVAAAVSGACEILLDGGVRSGTDILKALALGATGVLLGRPVLWSLAAFGEQGVHTALSLLATELRDALAFSGCPTPEAAHHLHLSSR